MNDASPARASATPVAHVASAGSDRSAGRFVAYAASLLFTIGWTLALGKDAHWDALNYHLYLGYSALNDRFAQDFFGAGAPSYLNPYAYVPLWLMTRAGVPAFAMATVFAALHAMILWLTYELAMVARARDDTVRQPAFALLAVALAALNPVLLQWIGATAIDISTGVLVVGGWLAVAIALRDGKLGALAAAGVLCGVAAALKLSNALFAMAVLPALLLLPGPPFRRLRGSAVFGIACGVAFVVVALPWSLELWEEFGNPFFPFLNHWFHSPDFTDAPLRYERFIPDSWLAFLYRPFAMVAPGELVHTEPRAPDLRYAVLIGALALWAAIGLGRVVGARLGRANGSDAIDPASLRVLLGLTVGVTTSWCLWLAQSGNSRYFVPMACVSAVVLALVLQRLCRRWRKPTLLVIALLLVWQVVQIAFGADWKRGGLAWEGPWIRVQVPDRYRNEPYLHLSAAFLSGSVLVPYLHPRSGLINITGFTVIGPGGPGGTRAQAMIERNLARVRLLTPLPSGMSEPTAVRNFADAHAGLVRRYGLRIDSVDCDILSVEGNLRGSIRRPGDPPRSPWTHFASCRLEHAPGEAARFAREVREVDVIFDRVEDACPNLFQPRRPLTEQRPHWVRLYNAGTEMQLWIDSGRVKYFLPVARKGEPIDIGAAEDWARGPLPIDCSRKFTSAPARR
jgi:Glycosyltransferase family 87